MNFEPFDEREEIEQVTGNLPHWRQDGKTYFVTFRTADSLPLELLNLWKAELSAWLQTHPEPWSQATRKEYFIRFSRRLDKWLDRGFGQCLLAKPAIKLEVENALHYFAGDRYELGPFVVMPNHVHVILMPLGNWTLSTALQSVKSYTAKKINRLVGQSGVFWQKESYDHLIRDEEALWEISEYIRLNPGQAAIE